MDNIIQSLKEFIWDIIGYLVPGAFLLILINFLVSTENLVENKFLFDWNVFQNSLIILLAYVFGYIIYSITSYKIYIQDKLIEFILNHFKIEPQSGSFVKYINHFAGKRHSNLWTHEFKKSELYKAVISKLKNEIPNIELMKVNEVRNILMTKNDKQSQVIYTFMFRSSIFDHISTTFIIVLFLLGIQEIFSLNILKTGVPYSYVYFAMILVIPLLGNSKRFFFPKAIRVPFSNV